MDFYFSVDCVVNLLNASVWGLAGHELGERENEQKERKRVEKRPVWLGVARDSEKESRQSERERERAEIE